MKALWIAGSLITAGLLVGGCGHGSSTAKKTYSVTLTNLTYQQPLSPLAAVLHTKSYRMYEVGCQAGAGLERLAEGGDNALLLYEANLSTSVSAVADGGTPVPPGGSATVMLQAKWGECLSLASMLVNTNDAFAALSCLDVSGLAIGEKTTVNLVAYDAGTEANSETAGTVPGPAGGGEGYNAQRDDRGFVAAHGGVVTSDDGLETSALSAAHRWDNPVAELTIERID
jgi:hypothetical protein